MLKESQTIYGISSQGKSKVCNSNIVSDIEIWHQHLRHINFKNLSKLYTKQTMKDISELKKKKPNNPIYGPS